MGGFSTGDGVVNEVRGGVVCFSFGVRVGEAVVPLVPELEGIRVEVEVEVGVEVDTNRAPNKVGCGNDAEDNGVRSFLYISPTPRSNQSDDNFGKRSRIF
jgi:hypothetical protein